MIRYLRRALRAHLLSQRSLSLLTMAGVALGVAAVFSVHLLNRSAVGAFGAAVTAVSGAVDLSVVPAGPSIPERAYVLVLADRAVARAAPIVRGGVRVRAEPPFSLEVVGVDLLQQSAVPFAGAARPELGDVLAPTFVALPAPLLRARDLALGDRIEVSCGTRTLELTIGAALDLRARHALAADRTAILDIALAQALLFKEGVLDRIDVKLRADADANAAKQRLQQQLGPACAILTPAERAGRAEGLLDAFRLNLTALSVVSLLVGLFLVRGSVEALLLRRRAEFGLLRTLGASRTQVLALILVEVLLIALPGVICGLLLGYQAAASNLRAVSATITNLYLLEAVERLDASPALFAAAGAAGLLGALLGALLPARAIACEPPRTLLGAAAPHEGLERRAGWLALGALLLAGGASASYALLGHAWRPSGFALGAAVLLALPWLTPWSLRVVAGAMRPRGLGFALAWRSLGQRLRSAATAASSLALAVAMLLSITLLLSSFRETVRAWLDATLRADLYVSTESYGRDTASAQLDAGSVAALAAFPGVRAIDRVRRFPAWIGARRVTVLGIDLEVPEAHARFPLFGGDAPAVFARVAAGAVLLGEPLARKLGKDAGDEIALPSPAGETRFEIAGVYRDYTSELGTVVMERARMDALWGAAPSNAVSLFLDDPEQVDIVEDALRAHFAGTPLVFHANRALRAEALRVFDQTFLITRIVQVLALVIAACAVALALLVIGREAAPEVALLLALGASRRQVFAQFLGMGALLGLAGVVLGAIGGAALAWVLVYAVNRAYFGWTIEAHAPSLDLLVQLATIGVAVLLASLYPALRASRTPATELTRDAT